MNEFKKHSVIGPGTGLPTMQAYHDDINDRQINSQRSTEQMLMAPGSGDKNMAVPGSGGECPQVAHFASFGNNMVTDRRNVLQQYL